MEKPVRLCEPLCLALAASKDVLEELALYCQALYREQDRAAAGERFADRQKLCPDRLLYDLCSRPREFFREHPPGRAWDGAFTIKTK